MPETEPSTLRTRIWRSVAGDVGVLAAIALAKVLLHTAVNNRYGFHRDELLTINNARHLDWGYSVYPPITAALGRISLELFGPSLRGFRLFAAIAESLALLLTGLIARELGGKRSTQVLAALAVAIAGHSLVHGSFMSYSSFDFPCWILVAYCVVRLLKSDDPRWWIAIGASMGLGMMAKYTMAFLALGVGTGLLFTPARKYLKSPWFWIGVAVALAIMAPNFIWQVRHGFPSLAYLQTIHARDISRGWTDHFLINQLWKTASPVALPLWCAGLWFLFATPQGKRYRIIGWMYVVPLVALFFAKGRDYYLSAAYPMLIAPGAVWGEQWIETIKPSLAISLRRTAWYSVAIAGLCTAAVTLPLAPLGSTWWRFANNINGVFDEEIGWPDMVQTVAKIRDSLTTEERANLGILAGDEGETGAINLYGPAHALPRAISGMNSNWDRGYPDPPPQTVIVLGERREYVERIFEWCELAGHVTNRYGIANSSIIGYDEIFVCRRLRQPWPEFWKNFRYYG